MTREKLLNLICDVHPCVDFNLFFNNWLDKYDKQIRADAIDEFARKLYEGCNEMIETCGSNIAPISWAEAYADFKVDIEEIAERLKEQKK